jgi:O-antigen ligase
MVKQLLQRISWDFFIRFLLFLMVAGLLFSRAILSISHLFLLIWIILAHPKNRQPQSTMTWWSILALLLTFLGCWQSPFSFKHFDLLVTWTMYPIAFFCIVRLTEPILQFLIRICQWAALAGILYALLSYCINTSGWIEAYGTGQSLPTFMDSDHVRFGIFLCGTGLITWLSDELSIRNKYIFCFILIGSILFMAVRSAWIGALILVLTLSYFSSRGTFVQRSKTILLIILLISLAILSGYILFPTIQQKWNYMAYDWQQYSFQYNRLSYSDGARRLVNSLAWETIQTNPVTGFGWSNIAPALRSAFTNQYPGEQLTFNWPFNQWLFWGLGSGSIGALLFTGWVGFPFLKGVQEKNVGIIAWTLVILASCLVESTLAFQYGVWLHAWMGAIAWRLSTKKRDTSKLNE